MDSWIVGSGVAAGGEDGEWRMEDGSGISDFIGSIVLDWHGG